MYTSNYKKYILLFFLGVQLAEELIYQGWRDEVQELVALFSKPNFKVKSISFHCDVLLQLHKRVST